MPEHRKKRIWNSDGKYNHHATKFNNRTDPIAKGLRDFKATVDKVNTDYDRKNKRKFIEEEIEVWENE